MSAWVCDNEKRSFFSKRDRIARQDGFAGILKKRVYSNQWFAVYLQPNNLGFSRLGLIVSKRLIPKAVQRNKIKRMIRESFRVTPRCGVEFDVVVRLKVGFDAKNQAHVNIALTAAFREILITK